MTALVASPTMREGSRGHGRQALFAPRGIALVGATERSRWSVQTFRNLQEHSPETPVHLVAPKGGVVHGVQAYRSLTEIEGPVDLAYVMSPRETVAGVIREASAVGVRAAVVLTAGFGETEDGRALESDLRQAAHETGITLLGPNVSGYINVLDKVVPFGLALAELPTAGPAAYVMQSGGLVKPLLAMARAWGAGVGLVACTGNEATLTASDLALDLLEDPRVGAVGMFLESIRDPEGMRRLAARALELDKAVVALTIGRTDVAQRTAAAHTGALARDAAVTSAVLRSLGIIEVTSLEELVATTDLLALGVRPAGPRIAVVGASGGACGLIAERASEVGLTLPDFTPEGARALGALLPDISTAQNPLDVTGVATTDTLLPVRAMEAILTHTQDAFDAVLFEAFVLPGTDDAEVARSRSYLAAVADVVAQSPIPVLLQDEVSAPISKPAAAILAETGLVRLPGVEVGLAALGHASRWVRRYERLRTATAQAGPSGPVPLELGVVPGHALSEADTLALLARVGVPVIPQERATSAQAAVETARRFGAPVALKVSSPDIQHKSDVGGVVLGRVGDAQVAEAYDQILQRVGSAVPDAAVDGVLVSPMRTGGVEIIVGINRDPVWGEVLVVGLGGVLVEVMADVALRPLPVTAEDVHEMLGELRGSALLDGVRGAPPVDRERVVEAVLALAGLAGELGDTFESIEINPLRADERGAEALDGLIVWCGQDTSGQLRSSR